MSKRASLSDVQKRVLEEFERRAKAGEAPPSHRDLMAVFGWKSPAAARYQIAALVKKGYLRMHAGKTRGAHLPDLGGGVVGSIPLVDRFSKSGKPLKIASDLQFSVTFHPGDPSVAFNVPDNKMKANFILVGDIVIVRTDLAPKPDDLVGVVIDGRGHAMTVDGARRAGHKVIGVVRQVIRAYSASDW